MSGAIRRALSGAVVILLGALLGCAASGGLTPGREPGAQTYGQRLLVQRCSGCHKTPSPAAMTRQRWLGGLDRMQRRIHLPPADWDTLAAMAAAEKPAGQP